MSYLCRQNCGWIKGVILSFHLLSIYSTARGLKCYQCSELKLTKQVIVYGKYEKNSRVVYTINIVIICFTQYTFYCLFKTTCPGSLLHDFPRGDFCRLIALSDGTVVNQEAVTETLCLEPSIKYTKGRIGQDFLDTNSRKLSRLLFNARCLAKL